MEKNKFLDSSKSFEKVMLKGEEILCRRIFGNILDVFKQELASSQRYKKKGIITAYQATERIVISTKQDGMENYAEVGDWVIKNIGDDDPYVFGSKNDSVQVRQEKFAKSYESIDGKPEQFKAKGIIRAYRVPENLIYNKTDGVQTVVKKGGWISETGRAIDSESFARTYELVVED